MSVDKVELLIENDFLRKRVVKLQSLLSKSTKAEIERTAQLMLLQAEVLDEGLEKDQPKLYKSLVKLSEGD